MKHTSQVVASQLKAKFSAITAMPPSTKKQVQSFIGMINYLYKFSVRLSELAEPIREFSKDKVPFNSRPEHQQAFTQVKKEISSVPVLAHYNPEKQTVLQTDASIKVVGACLLQEEKPVYVASKALTDAQKGCFHIDRITCSGLAMEKFH